MTDEPRVLNKCRTCDEPIPYGQVHCNLHRRGKPDSQPDRCPKCKGPLAPGRRLCLFCRNQERSRLARSQRDARIEAAKRSMREAP